MLYRKRSDLSIIELKDGEEDISFDRLEKAILSRPSGIIYCERNKKLHGIITMGDIDRASEAGREFVTVNTGFISLSEGEYMKAREIFRDRENIHAIPILDEDGKLTGGWSRWNDRLHIEHMFDGGGGRLSENPTWGRWYNLRCQGGICIASRRICGHVRQGAPVWRKIGRKRHGCQGN